MTEKVTPIRRDIEVRPDGKVTPAEERDWQDLRDFLANSLWVATSVGHDAAKMPVVTITMSRYKERVRGV